MRNLVVCIRRLSCVGIILMILVILAGCDRASQDFDMVDMIQAEEEEEKNLPPIKTEPLPPGDELVALLTQKGFDTSGIKKMVPEYGENFHVIITDGAKAESLQQELRRLLAGHEYYPVIIQKGFYWVPPGARSIPAVIEATLSFDVLGYHKKRAASDEFLPDEPRDEWPKKVDKHERLTIPFYLFSQQPRPEIYIVIVPTQHAWQAPIYLNWDVYHEDEELSNVNIAAAMFKYWQEKYGAEIVAMEGSVVEAIAQKPPTTREQAMDLAREQFVFCYDIVYQGVGSIDYLAATLLGSKYWYFWWD